MRVLPILFNTEMVRAIRDGRKKCTRRIVKIPNYIKQQDDGLYTLFAEGTCYENQHFEEIVQYLKKPYQPGDILYVRETWQCWRAHRYEATADIRFRAGGDDVRLQFANGSTDSIDRYDFDTFVHKWFSHNGEWKPSLFMPKEAARIWLKVTDVSVERLNDITDKDAEREGAQPDYPFDYAVDKWPNLEHFKEIWNGTIKKSDLDRYGWDANPWVWVIEFGLCDKPSEPYQQNGE